MNALTVVFAALCIFAIGYRFYGLFIANKVLNLNDARVTPVVKYPTATTMWIPTSTCFRAPFRRHRRSRPLLGPVLAAQFGYMPGLLWILIGCVLAGGVQIWSCCSPRCGTGAEPRLHRLTGNRQDDWPVAAWAVLATLLLTLAGLSIAVVNAMHNSLWSTYTVAATILIAIIMGLYMQIWRKGMCSAPPSSAWSCFALCILTGPYVAAHPETSGWLDIDKKPMSILDPCTASPRRSCLCDAAPAARLPVHLPEDRHHRRAGPRHRVRHARLQHARVHRIHQGRRPPSAAR